MQTIVRKDTNVSLYYLADNKTVNIGSDQTTISDGGTPELIISDCIDIPVDIIKLSKYWNAVSIIKTFVKSAEAIFKISILCALAKIKDSISQQLTIKSKPIPLVYSKRSW